jgi:hypothetical protein
VLDVLGDTDTIGPDNVISWNGTGIDLYDTEHLKVAGNKIGTDASGAADLPNGVGVALAGAKGTAVTTNQFGVGAVGVVTQGSYAITFPENTFIEAPKDRDSQGSTLAGNLFNTNAKGTAQLTQPTAYPVRQDETVISVDKLEDAAKPKNGKWPPSNGLSIFVDDGSKQTTIGGSSGNVFAGKAMDGIFVGDPKTYSDGPTDTAIQNNHFGMTRSGKALDLRVGLVVIKTSGVTLGGLTKNAGNTIGNGLVGVELDTSSKKISVLSNSIYANSEAGIRDNDRLRSEGVDSPTIVSAKPATGGVQIRATVKTHKGDSYRVQFFANPSCAGTNATSGRTWINDDQTFKADKGAHEIDAKLSAPGLAKGMGITALVTTNGDTSAFSNCEQIAK